jgi:hypothetical protein
MTLFREKMTRLFEKTPISGSDWLESAFSLPGIGGLLHSYRGLSFRARVSSYPTDREGKTFW